MKSTIIIISTLILLVSSVSAYEINFYHNDHLGSPAVITNKAGEIIWKADYEPFGETINEVGDNKLKYNAKEQDKTGLLYYGSRYYNPGIGRFITADTVKGKLIDTQSLNRYTYVKNNPLKYIDLKGNQAESYKLSEEYIKEYDPTRNVMHPESILQRARIYRQIGYNYRALANIDILLGTEPSNPEATLLKSQLLYEEYYIEEAVGTLEKSLELYKPKWDKSYVGKVEGIINLVHERYKRVSLTFNKKISVKDIKLEFLEQYYLDEYQLKYTERLQEGLRQSEKIIKKGEKFDILLPVSEIDVYIKNKFVKRIENF